MGLLDRIFKRAPEADFSALYARIVALARLPHWYVAGGVPDTLDGRFDMVALVLSLVLIRLEGDGEAGRLPTARLTERFIDDMDGQIREIGFGDMVVGKQVAKVVSALGGRLGAYRTALSDEALVRNLYRGHAPTAEALAHVRGEAAALQARIIATPFDALLAGHFE